jgi:hypothetical protein
MALTYSNLVAAKTTSGSIQEWVNNSNVPAATVLSMAEEEIYRRLRIRDMRTLLAGTLAVDDTSITLPTEYRTPLFFTFTGQERATVDQVPVDAFEQAKGYGSDDALTQSKPTAYMVDGTTLYFNAKALKAYGYNFWHFAALAPLSTSNETNILTDRYPLLLMMACAWMAYLFLRNDEEIAYYEARTQALIQQANAESDESLHHTTDMPIIVE